MGQCHPCGAGPASRRCSHPDTQHRVLARAWQTRYRYAGAASPLPPRDAFLLASISGASLRKDEAPRKALSGLAQCIQHPRSARSVTASTRLQPRPLYLLDAGATPKARWPSGSPRRGSRFPPQAVAAVPAGVAASPRGHHMARSPTIPCRYRATRDKARQAIRRQGTPTSRDGQPPRSPVANVLHGHVRSDRDMPSMPWGGA